MRWLRQYIPELKQLDISDSIPFSIRCSAVNRAPKITFKAPYGDVNLEMECAFIAEKLASKTLIFKATFEISSDVRFDFKGLIGESYVYTRNLNVKSATLYEHSIASDIDLSQFVSQINKIFVKYQDETQSNLIKFKLPKIERVELYDCSFSVDSIASVLKCRGGYDGSIGNEEGSIRIDD